jgi:hypothetical protein
MSSYRFVGTRAEIHNTPPGGKEQGYILTRFGQLVELPDDLAKHAIAEGVALIKPSDFDEIGFTPDELKKFANPDTHVRATDSFKAKKRQSWDVLHGVVKPKPKPEPVEALETPAKPEINPTETTK